MYVYLCWEVDFLEQKSNPRFSFDAQVANTCSKLFLGFDHEDIVGNK